MRHLFKTTVITISLLTALLTEAQTPAKINKALVQKQKNGTSQIDNKKSKKNNMTNLAIIKSTYEGKNSKENSDNLAKHVSENIVWIEAKGFPYAGTYIGIQSIIDNVFSRLTKEWTSYTFTPETYIAEGDKVVAVGTYSGIYNTTQKKLSARVAHIWQLKEGKIIRFEQIVDSKIVADTML